MRVFIVCVLVSMVTLIVPTIGWGSEFIEEGSLLGVGVMMTESPYKGVDDGFYTMPFLSLEAKRFFVDKTSAGYYFNDKSSAVRWALIGSMRLQGYRSGDSDHLSGMQDRDRALDGGLRVSWKNKIVDMNLQAVMDISGTHEGQELRLSFSKTLFKRFLTPKASVKWQSSDLADYYYGVRPNEARAGRAEYIAGDGLQYSAGITIALPLGKKWALFGDIECTFLGDEVSDSPIVGQDRVMRYGTGVVYRF